MKIRNIPAAALAALLATWLSESGGADWVIPSPDSCAHPGAKEAPASSPKTYPDERGFQARCKTTRQGLVTVGLGTYRKGWFTGGDPGKYLTCYAMARLIEKQYDPTPARYMNDDRSYKEHYHFAAVNWARFYPIFGEKVLTEDTRKKFANAAFQYGSYLSPRGTENHKTMWMTSVNVLPWYTGRGLSRRNWDSTLEQGREMLKDYVKGLYMAGQGEWDSSTYLMFDVNGMLNIYDFAKDEELRLLAKAALDWYTAAYALKYTDGVYCAPNQRGFASGAVEKIADQTGWLWWGSNRRVVSTEMKAARHTMHAQTTSWRPNKVLCNIAQRKLPRLPVEQRNSKPNYWYGTGRPWQAGVYRETVYMTPHYTMGSLWNGHGSQMTRFQIAAASDQGGVVFTGGSPRRSDHTGKKIDFGYRDGIGRYDQSAQAGPIHITMSLIPDADPMAYCFFSYPGAAGTPEKVGKWFVIRAGETFVGVRPLGGEGAIGETELTGKQKELNLKEKEKGRGPKYRPHPIIRVPGRRVGFIAVTADTTACRDKLAFKTLLGQAKVDVSKMATHMDVTCVAADGLKLRMRFSPATDDDRHGDRMAAAWVNGREVPKDGWPIYSGPYVRQRPGVLTVSDGREGFTVDFTGDLPVYRAAAR